MKLQKSEIFEHSKAQRTFGARKNKVFLGFQRLKPSRKAEIEFSTLVYAALALIVLVVIIGVFFALTNPSFRSLLGIVEDTSQNSQDSINWLAISIGRCDTGKEVCFSGSKYICNSNNKWEKTDNEC